MPIVEVHVLEGKTVEQKRAMVKAVTEAICKTFEVTPDRVRIIIDDMKHHDFSIAGELTIDRK